MTEPLVVASTAAFQALLAELATEPLVAVDTESAGFHRYSDRIYLVQLSSRSRTAIVDPIAVPDLQLLRSLLANPGTEIVFHDAESDLRLLDRDFGIRAANLFDTRVASQILNEPGIGLAALLERYCGVTLDKRYQRADWSQRPLTPPMLEYAAADTHHLPLLRDILREKLIAAGRLAWAAEEFELIAAMRRPDPEERASLGYLRLKGASAVKGREAAVLSAVFDWREALAKQTDRAPFRILNNDVLFLLAKAPPESLEALRDVRGIGRELAERRGAELLEVIDKAMALPEDAWPRPEWRRRERADPAFVARLERLKVARNRIAERLALAPGVACPNGTLEAIATAVPGNVSELAGLIEVRKWQAETFGNELLQALQGLPTA